MEKKTGETGEAPAGKTINAAGMLEYQEGAIVSRTLIDKTGGTLTLFAFDEGQGLSEHTTPFDALVYILDGEAEVTISGSSSRVRQGEMIIMPANEPHALKATRRFKMMLVMIKSWATPPVRSEEKVLPPG